MPSPYNITNLPAPRVDFIDPRTGLMAREWYRFFFNLFNLTGAGTTDTSLADLQMGPPAINEVLGELGITYDQAQLAAMMSQYEQATRDIQNQLDTAPAAPQLGTLSTYNEDNVRLIGFDTSPSPAVPNPAPTGTLYWDGNSTLGLQMNQSVLVRIGQAQFVYAKASSAITKGQLCKHTGAIGASGVITAAPTSTNMTDTTQIIGVAAQDIALNDFGFIQVAGDLRGFDTTGSSVGEVWADGDSLYYNPSFVGSFTKNKPSAPNLKTYIGEIINAGAGGSGSINIHIVYGSTLGGTDSNVQFGTLVDKDLIQYDGALQYWKNVAASSISIGTATNLAGGAAGSVPYQSGAGATTFLPIGTAGQYAKINAGATAPEWANPAALTKTDDTNVTLTLGGNASTALLNAASLTLGWTGSLSAVRGGTGQSSYTTGDLLYASDSSTLSKLAGVATGNVLISGGVSTAPSWGKVGLTTHVSGTLGATNGGTGNSSYAVGDILYAFSTTGLARLASVATGNALISKGVGVAPAWGKIDLSTSVTGTLGTLSGGTGSASVFTDGSIVFAGAGGVYSQNNGYLFWDRFQCNLGIGTNTPKSQLEVKSAGGSVFRFGRSGFESNGSLYAEPGLCFMTGDSYLDASLNFIATNSTAGLIEIDGSGFSVAINSGLTAGVAFSPLARFMVTENNTAWLGSSTSQAVPTTGTLRVEKASGTNIAGATLKLIGGNSTGTGVGGPIAFFTSPAGTTGAAENAEVERVRITGAGDVGIGTTAPLSKLHVDGTVNGAVQMLARNLSTGISAYSSLQAQANTTAYGTMRTYGSGQTGVAWGVTLANYTAVFADGAASNGLIVGTYTADPILLGTNNAERVRIDSSGNVGIGSTTPAAKLDVNGDIRTNQTFLSVQAWDATNGGGQIYLNGTTGNRIDYSTAGVAAPAFTTRSAGTKIVYYPQVGAAAVDYAVGIEGGTLWHSVPTTAGAFKWYGGTTAAATLSGTGNLTLTGTVDTTGVTFPATQVASAGANTLDDYEEGTFTPTIIGTTTAGAGTYTTQGGRYTKIGRVVHVQIRLTWTAHTGTGNMQIEGLPFNSETATAVGGASFGYINNVAYTAGATPIAYVTSGANNIVLAQYPSGGGAAANVPMDTAGDYMLTLTYFTTT